MTADTGRLIADQAAERHQGRCLLAGGCNRTLWQPCLRHAFPGARQARLHDAVDHLRLFRNRIAHHEPVHTWDLTGDYTRIRGTTERISPRLAWWIDTTSGVPCAGQQAQAGDPVALAAATDQPCGPLTHRRRYRTGGQ